MNAMYSVEQVNVPPELGTIMKQFTKAVLRDHPENVYKYGANFFAVLSGKPAPFDQDGQLVEGDSSPSVGKRAPPAVTSSAVDPSTAAPAVAKDADEAEAAPPQSYQADEDPSPVATQADVEQLSDEEVEFEEAAENKEDAEDPDTVDAENAEANEITGVDESAGMTEEEAVIAIFQKYSVGEEGMTSVDYLPNLLADLRETLGLSEEELPPAEEIVELLNCQEGVIDLLELKQLLFESEE